MNHCSLADEITTVVMDEADKMLALRASQQQKQHDIARPVIEVLDRVVYGSPISAGEDRAQYKSLRREGVQIVAASASLGSAVEEELVNKGYTDKFVQVRLLAQGVGTMPETLHHAVVSNYFYEVFGRHAEDKAEKKKSRGLSAPPQPLATLQDLQQPRVAVDKNLALENASIKEQASLLVEPVCRNAKRDRSQSNRRLYLLFFSSFFLNCYHSQIHKVLRLQRANSALVFAPTGMPMRDLGAMLQQRHQDLYGADTALDTVTLHPGYFSAGSPAEVVRRRENLIARVQQATPAQPLVLVLPMTNVRGLDLPHIALGIVLGTPRTANDYVHLAGKSASVC